MTGKEQFQMYELENFLGDYISDFDVDAIVEEATEVDYRTGNRFWKEGVDLGEIAERHPSVSVMWAVSTWKEDRTGCPKGDEIELFSDEEEARMRYAGIDLRYSWETEYNCFGRLCIDPCFKQLGTVEVTADGEFVGDVDEEASERYGWDEHEGEQRTEWAGK